MTTALRPQPAPPRPYHFPRFERHTFESGARLFVAPQHALPLVTALVVVDAGAASEPLADSGVARLTARALLEGTRQRSADALVERLELLGATLSAGSDWDAAMLSLTVLAPRLDEALALVREVLLEPAFADAEVARLREERLAELLQRRTDPGALAADMFSAFVYAPRSRYALPEEGSAETVRPLDASAVRAFHQARYRAGAVTCILAGDITAERGVRLAETLVAGLPAGAPPAVALADAPARTTRAVHVVETPGAEQAELRLGHVGPPRGTADYFPCVVMNSILGGLFNSRINLNLREVHGYTYGASSGFDWRRGHGPFAISSAVATGVATDAVREVLHEVERMRAEPVAAEELTLATSYLAGVFPIRYETTAAIARALAAMAVFDLPADYFDRYRAHVEGVSAADVLAAARAHLHPEAMQIVAVGDAAALREPLAALDVGPLTVYDDDGGPTAARAAPPP